MDIIEILRLAIISPFAAFATVSILFLLGSKNYSFKGCAKSCLKFGAITAAVLLVVLILWSIVYGFMTGASSAQAPLAWIFFFGPISFAIGEFLGFAMWSKNMRNGKP